MFRSKSHNRMILHKLMRKGRRKNLPLNMRYYVLYAFLYKYMSDKLKNHLMYYLAGDEADLNMLYLTGEGTDDLRQWALNDMGYFFTSQSAFIDQFISNKYVDDIFSPDFFKNLKNNIEFSQNNPSKDYFDQIIEILEDKLNFTSLYGDEDLTSFMSSYIFSISKFDIDEREFTFAQVYDAIAYSRQIRLSSTPDYISELINSIVKSQRNSVSNAYDPFLKDASILFNLYNEFTMSDIYAKENNELHYFYSLIKAFINEINFENLHMSRENAIKSMSYDSQLFDLIASKLPNSFDEFSKTTLKSQSIEVPSETDFKEKLFNNLDMDKLSDDKEALEALKVLEKRLNAMEKSEVTSFTGEYESLKDSEFLFLINMINSLKDNGLMVISLSQNFLFKNSLALLRKFLTYENNYIDAVISLPEELGGVIRPEVVIVFRKNKSSDDVVFIDLSKKYGTEMSPNTFPGLVKRNLVLDKKTISNIIDVLNNRKTVDKFSEIVSLKQLEENDFNLSVSRYVDTYDGEFIRLNDLKSDKKKIDEKMDSLNERIDELLGDLNFR